MTGHVSRAKPGLRTDLYRKLRWQNQIAAIKSGEAIDILRSFSRDVRAPLTGGSIDYLCMFFGPPRSGTSIIGALLDAHRNILIAHELDILKYFSWGLSSRSIFPIIAANSRRMASGGRAGGGYDARVDTGWQGRCLAPSVIGDKKAAMTAFRLAHCPDLLHEIRAGVPVKLRFVRVIRNPFDTISSMWKGNRRRTDLQSTIDLYVEIMKCCALLTELLAPEERITLHLEAVVNDPTTELQRICRFLGQSPGARFLEECETRLFPSPKRTHEGSKWPRPATERVQALIQSEPVLSRYR